jgi:prophage regulatory protein
MAERKLYAMAELADRLNVSRQRAAEIAERPDFPAPYDQVRAGRLWLISEVEAWIREHRPNLADEA